MRVITGNARGRKLLTLAGEEVRPTPERVKEAVFSIIQFQIEGRSFLALFAGSGQMGIEALSRGARKSVFVDAKRESVETVKKNLENTGLKKDAEVVLADALAYLRRCRDTFDLAFLDPPYYSGLLQETLPMVAEIMNRGGLIICESPQNEDLSQKIGDFVLDRSYRYGKIKINIYCHKDVVR